MVAPRQRLSDKRDRLKQLRAFYYAAHLESITRAAEHLDLTQTAVSTRVRALERELGAELFDRSGHRISRTPGGETLYRLVAHLVTGVDDLLVNFSERSSDILSGEIRIGATQCVATSILPLPFSRFHDLYPSIRLHIKRCVTEEAANLLLADEVELLLGPETSARTDIAREKLAYRPLYPYEFVLATPLDHPLAGRKSVTQEEIAASQMIVRRAGMYSAQSGVWPGETIEFESETVLRASAWDIVKRHVEAGLGIAILPSTCVTDRDRLAIIPLTQYFGSRTSGLFTRNDRSLSPSAERLAAHLESQVAGCSPSAG